MTIKPLLHRILVKPDNLEDIDPMFKAARAVGIVTDFNERKREQDAVDTGTIVDFGPTVFKDFDAENTLKIGDRVIYARYGGKAVVDPATKEKFVALNDEDLICLVTD